MKTAVILTLILFSVIEALSAQTAVISQPQYNVLYSGCSNVVQIGRQDTIKNTVLTADGMDIQQINSYTGIYAFTPRGKDAILLYILNENKEDTLDIIPFRVLPIPDAEIYLGNSKSGEVLSDKSNLKISLKLPSYVSVEANMSIEDWSISIDSNKEDIFGTGSVLNEEAAQAIQNAKKNSVLELHVAYKTNGKGIKRQTVNFTL